ncbi:hypothetical protein V6N12_020234 [Hibiscus sabdariffa]|uniref:Uncharacterized protein n=1 Tax=Hibiscus sabdariffa TaxID=183260 RepID=A0ABR2BMU5_9ROSI
MGAKGSWSCGASAERELASEVVACDGEVLDSVQVMHRVVRLRRLWQCVIHGLCCSGFRFWLKVSSVIVVTNEEVTVNRGKSKKNGLLARELAMSTWGDYEFKGKLWLKENEKKAIASQP